MKTFCYLQVEAEKDATIEGLHAQLAAAGFSAAALSPNRAQLRAQLGRRASRDDTLAVALRDTLAKAERLDALCARTARSSGEQARTGLCA